MTNQIRAAVALDRAISADAIRAAVSGESDVTLAGFVSATPDSLSRLTQLGHDAVLVACAGDSPEALAFISQLATADPQCPVVVAYQGPANGFVSEAFEAGAADLITGDITIDGSVDGRLGRDIAFALQKAIARRSGHTTTSVAQPATGQMIAVLGPKGGTGKTLTACNLATGLAAAGASVIVVDLDLQFGDVGLALGLRPERTLYELATAGGTMDAEKVADFLIEHPSGVRALLAPRRPDHAGGINVEFTRSLFDTLRQMAEFVIVDTPPGFTPEVIAAIDRSSSVCVVAMLDALSLKNSKLALETLDLMGYDRGRVKIVLNRADSRVGVTAEDVADLLGQAPDVRVPSHRDITRSVNEATPIVLSGGNAEAKRAFQALAASYLDPAKAVVGASAHPVAKPRRHRRRLLRRRKGAN